MKKLFCILLTLSLLFSLSACSAAQKPAESDPPAVVPFTPAEPETPEAPDAVTEPEEPEAPEESEVPTEPEEPQPPEEPALPEEPQLPEEPEEPMEPEVTDLPEESETPEEPQAPELVDGMRPDFKAAMDSYEAFYDEYCDFLTRYQANPMDLRLLADYAVMMTRLSEMEEAFDAWDAEDMNPVESAYYFEVSARVLQKLSAVAN